MTLLHVLRCRNPLAAEHESDAHIPIEDGWNHLKSIGFGELINRHVLCRDGSGRPEEHQDRHPSTVLARDLGVHHFVRLLRGLALQGVNPSLWRLDYCPTSFDVIPLA